MLPLGFVFTVDAQPAPLRPAVHAGTGPVLRAIRTLTPAIALAVVIAALLANVTFRHVRDDALASQPAIERPAAPADTQAIAVTISAGGHRAPWATTIAELKTSPAMWKRMHFSDWNDVPEEIRETSFVAMLKAYQHEIRRPEVWDRMDVVAWDEVPQPVRVAAFRRMTAYWVGFYRLAQRFGLQPSSVNEVAQALVMSESWFDHRAVAQDRSGNIDIGLGQASTFARKRIRQLHASGVVDFAFTDQDYLDPWRATRFVATWLGLLLEESGGDLELAVRAYNRGISDALDERGDLYLTTVMQRRRRYIQGSGAPAAWQLLMRLLRDEPVQPSKPQEST